MQNFLVFRGALHCIEQPLTLRSFAFNVFLYFDVAENSQIFGLAIQDDLDFDKRALVPLSLRHLGLLPPALKIYFCSIFMICIDGNYHLRFSQLKLSL